jgi:hypothetical protein
VRPSCAAVPTSGTPPPLAHPVQVKSEDLADVLLERIKGGEVRVVVLSVLDV